jgi:hypothetical protein
MLFLLFICTVPFADPLAAGLITRYGIREQNWKFFSIFFARSR